MSEEKLPEQVWTLMQQRLGYSDQELEQFKANPRNEKVLQKAALLSSKTIVFEVVESKGCNSQHTLGTRFFFSGDGNLISKLAPKRVCAFAMPIMTQAIFAIHEMIYAGLDPNDILFKRGGCYDVGLECGGWGHIVLEAKVLNREEAAKLSVSDTA